MTDRETLYEGLSCGAWGYFFVSFDFNLGTVSVLPRFVGFWLLYLAIGKLSGEQRDLNLLRPLAILLTGWHFMDWCLSWAGGNVEGYIPFLDLLVIVVTLYVHFQFLTDMASLAGRYQPEGGDLDRRLLRRRTAYTLLMTAICLVSDMNGLYLWDGWSWASLALALVAMIVTFMIMFNLFELRRCVRDGDGGVNGPENLESSLHSGPSCDKIEPNCK